MIVGDGEQVIDDSGIVVRDDMIEEIGPVDTISPDPTQQAVSFRGKTVIPAIVAWVAPQAPSPTVTAP
ncbi:hypothetical protein [Streptomyces sp900116325]|uniref:hypothetical protein n=1 Tax=Streptomyces sp. 900116325 TaxID=3154295 RepID=UPI0033A57A3A